MSDAEIISAATSDCPQSGNHTAKKLFRFSMKITRRTKVRLETHEFQFVRGVRPATLFCSGCQTQTRHLTVAQAAQLLAIFETAVFRLAESERVHSTETDDGRLLICAVSAVNFED